MRLRSLQSAFIFDSILLFQKCSSFFLFFIFFIPNNLEITNDPQLTSLFSSVMLFVCAESITSSTSLVFYFNLTLSILYRFVGFGKMSFFNSLTIFPSTFCFLLCQYCCNWSIVPDFLHLSLCSTPFSATCCSVTCRIGSVPVRYCSSSWASALFSPLSTSLLLSSNCSCDNQPFF